METWEAAHAAFPRARMAPARELYHASADVLAEAIDAAAETAASLMIVGHNPGLHELSLALMANQGDRTEKSLGESFPTAAPVPTSFGPCCENCACACVAMPTAAPNRTMTIISERRYRLSTCCPP